MSAKERNILLAVLPTAIAACASVAVFAATGGLSALAAIGIVIVMLIATRDPRVE